MAKEDFDLVEICDSNDPDKDDKLAQARTISGIIKITQQNKKYMAVISKLVADGTDNNS